MVQGLLLSDKTGIFDLLLVVYQISPEQSQKLEALASQIAHMRRDYADSIDCWQSFWDEMLLRVHAHSGWYAATALTGQEDYSSFWGPFADPETAVTVAQRQTGNAVTTKVEVPAIHFPTHLPWVAQAG